MMAQSQGWRGKGPQGPQAHQGSATLCQIKPQIEQQELPERINLNFMLKARKLAKTRALTQGQNGIAAQVMVASAQVIMIRCRERFSQVVKIQTKCYHHFTLLYFTFVTCS
jgi:hypothetical protein